MDPRRILQALLHVLGGIAVLGSYAHGILTHDNPGTLLWGQVPEWLRPIYTVCMFSAAFGYLKFAYVFFFQIDPATTKIGPFSYGILNVLLLLILVPSALWMPLTFHYLAAPSDGRWFLVRLVLSLVGLAALGLIAAVLALSPRPKGRNLALVGAVFFAIQTALLDGLIWPAFFR